MKNEFVGLLSLFLCLLSLDLSAQYTGGKGDGYARASASVTITAVDKNATAAAWKLLPNRCLKGQPIVVEGPLGIPELYYCIYNVEGQLIQSKKQLLDPRVSTSKLPSGWYQLILFVGDQQINKTFVVVE